MTMRRRVACLAVALAALAVVVRASGALSFTVLAPGVDGSGLEYQPSSDSLVAVVRPSPSTNGSPLQMVTLDGGQFRFARAPELPFEAPLVVVHDDGDFRQGEMFTATGSIGQVAKLSTTGALVAAVWARLPGESGRVTALAFSPGEPFGRSLLAGTESGNVWRIDDDGRPTFVAATGYPVRALLAVPATEKYGASAGTLLVATGGPKCQLLAMDLSGRTADLRLDIGCANDLDLIAADTDLFFTGSILQAGQRVNAIVKVAQEGLASSACDVLVTHDEGPFSIVGWSPGRAYAIKAGTGDMKAVRSAFAGSPNACYPEVCGDGIDNNGNGEIDEDCPEPCLDPETCENHDEHADNTLSARAQTPDGPEARNAGCPAERWARQPDAWIQLDPRQLGGNLFSFPTEGDGAALSREPLLTLLNQDSKNATVPEVHRLVRAGIAAVLNGASPEVGYPLGPAATTEHVSTALESRNVQRLRALAGVLEAYNTLSCTLPARKQPSAGK